MKALKYSLIAILALSLTSCQFDLTFGNIRGNGNVQTAEREINDDFTEVKGSHGLDIFLTEGDENAIVVEADENLHEHISTEVHNGQLKIKATENIGSAKSKKIHVTYKKISGIYASSGADIIGNSLIDNENISLNSSSGAMIDIDINAGQVYADASSGSDLKVKGRAVKLITTASSGSDIQAGDLEVKSCKASASSGADIVVNVSEEIEGNASSGGDIRYYGNPTAISLKDGVSGSVRKM